MAEIKIEKKAPIWPWIVGLLIVAALLFYFFVLRDDTVDDVVNEKTKTEEPRVDEKVNRTAMTFAGAEEIKSYNDYISNSDMDMDHEYTSSAYSKLITATMATAAALNIDVDGELKGANAKMDEIKENPESMSHANTIKEVSGSISKALKKIQTEKYPKLQSKRKDVETAVSKIKIDTPTLDQKDAVKGFLKKSGNLLTSIKNDYGKAQ